MVAQLSLCICVVLDEISVVDLTDQEVSRLSYHIEWILRMLESEMVDKKLTEEMMEAQEEGRWR